MAEIKDPTPSSSVPPPPAEVKVRTMKSDIEGVAQAGGGMPQFKTVAVEGMGLPNSRIGGVPRAAGASSGSRFPWWILAIVLVVFGILVWFGYALILKK
jgi:hypothetical protein